MNQGLEEKVSRSLVYPGGGVKEKLCSFGGMVSALQDARA